MGDRARGLQRTTARRGPRSPHDQARSRVYRWSEDGLGGICDDRPAPVPGVRVLERAGPDPQGADLRPHEQRGQPRRGRQGALVVRRLHADALVDALALRLSPARLPLRGPRRPRTPAAASATPSTSCSTPTRWPTTATGTSRSTTRRPGRRTCACACASATPGPTPPSCTCSRRCGSATGGRGATAAERAGHPRGRRRARRERRRRDDDAHGRRRARGAVLQQRDEHAAPLGPARPAVSEGRHQRPRRDRRADRRPRPHRDEGGPVVPAARSTPGRRPRCGCG